MKMNFKYIISLSLLIAFLSTSAQQNNIAAFHVWADQKVAITGEEIWVDGFLNQPITNVRSITIRLVDRNGQTKSEVDVIPQRNSFSGFLSIPETLVSDYYFLDCFAKGLTSVSQLQPLMVVNPRLAPQGACQTSPMSSALNKNNPITIKTAKEEYTPRSLINVTLELPSPIDNLTVSAVIHDQLSAKMDSLSQLYPISFTHNSNGALENEGQVISVTATHNGAALKNTKLIVALKGSKAIVGTSTTNQNGIAKFTNYIREKFNTNFN